MQTVIILRAANPTANVFTLFGKPPQIPINMPPKVIPTNPISSVAVKYQ